MSTWNRTGTVSVTNGSPTVTGSGVSWSSIQAGDAFHGPDGDIYEVQSVTGDVMTLAVDYDGTTASGQNYAIQPTRGILVATKQQITELIATLNDLIDGPLAGDFPAGVSVAGALTVGGAGTFGGAGSFDGNLAVTGLISGDAITQSATDSTTGRMLKVGDSSTLLSASPSLRATLGGTADAVALTSGAGISGTIPTGFSTRFRAAVTNTGATTIALDGGTPIACRTVTGVALPAGYIRTDADTVATYDGTFWVLNRAPERGSNSNGTFTRLEDGTVFMEGSLDGAPVENSSGSVFRSNQQTVTYPISVSSPRTNINVSSALRWANMITTSAYRQWAGASSATASSAIYDSTARWYS